VNCNAVNIEFLFWEGCPSHDEALARLRQVMAEEGISSPVEVVEIETEEQAEAARFVGSPTIRIDGEDIDPPGEGAIYGLTCRAYRHEDGRITPLPTHNLIRRALLAAQQPG
jgi:hypothetical protein